MKVLVVEGEETTRKLMGVMLTRLGYKVALTSKCDEAFRCAARSIRPKWQIRDHRAENCQWPYVSNRSPALGG